MKIIRVTHSISIKNEDDYISLNLKNEIKAKELELIELKQKLDDYLFNRQ